MSAPFTTIIVADSRARGIDDFIGSHPTPPNHSYALEVHPGKTLAQLIPIIIAAIRRYEKGDYYCIVMAGINGLTDRARIEGRKALRYQSLYREDKTLSIIESIKFLKDNYGSKINIATIIPASLPGYFAYHNPSAEVPSFLEAEQKDLEADIISINETILYLHPPNFTNINLAKRAQKRAKVRRQHSGSKKVYRRKDHFYYSDLPDGLHFNDSLKSTCFRLIIDTAIRDSANLQAISDSDQASHRLQPWPVGPDPTLTSASAQNNDLDIQIHPDDDTFDL